MMKREWDSHDHMCVLYRDQSGNRFLDTVCGGIAMYEVRIKLTQDQVDQWQEEGEPFMIDVAYRVTKGEFKEQIVGT